MSKFGYRLINILLCIAFLLFFVVFFTTIFQSDKQHAMVLDVFPVFLLIVGITVAILTVYTKSAYQLFIGGFLAFSGLLSILIMGNIISGNLKQWWPIYAVASGIILFFAGFYKYRKIDFGYVIPAVVFEILGLWLLLFSFNIITIPFKTFILCFGPLLLVMLCILLFVFFLWQKKYGKFSSSDADIKQFEDDELIPE